MTLGSSKNGLVLNRALYDVTAIHSPFLYSILALLSYSTFLPTNARVTIPYWVVACPTTWWTNWLVGHRYTTRSPNFLRRHSPIRSPTSVLPLPVGNWSATSGRSSACAT